jgi:hypothetical protein
MKNHSHWALSMLLCQLVAAGAWAENPIVQTIYTADPAPLVHDGVFYVYTGHDEDGATWFNMREWRVFSTTDMANWTDLGSPMNLATFSWAQSDAWAGQCVFRNGKYYYYVPMRPKSGGWAIGVGVSSSPTGPFVDALGHPLVSYRDFYIDPTVFVDDDGQAYMYWGNPILYMVKLNEDMVSTSGEIVELPQTAQTVGGTYGEGPWFYKREGRYYLVFASDGTPNENIRYSTSSSPTGPWAYQDVIMPAEGKSWTNHAGVVDYKGRSYFVYHNAALPGGGAGTRSVCVEEFTYNADGSFPTIKMSQEGPAQIGHLNPFVTTQAETAAVSVGVETEKCQDSGGGVNVTAIHRGDSIKVKGVDFRAGATSFEARVASDTTGGDLELRLDGLDGKLLGTCSVESTGGAQKWVTKSCTVSGADGVHDLFFKFAGTGSGALFNFNWWRFTGPGGVEDPPDGPDGGSDGGGVEDGGARDGGSARPDAGQGKDAGSADVNGGQSDGGGAAPGPADAGVGEREGAYGYSCAVPGKVGGGPWGALGVVSALALLRRRRAATSTR